MTFPVFLDTNVLFGQVQCDVLLTLAEQGIYTPYWSQRVLDAVVRSVVDAGHGRRDAIERRMEAMNRAFPHAMVEGFDSLIAQMTNDPGDQHVLAACVASPAFTLVTANVPDFKRESTRPYGITVIHPDDFLLDLLDLHPGHVQRGLRAMLHRYERPPQDFSQLADWLARADAPKFAAALLRL